MFTIARKAIILPDSVSCDQVSLVENIRGCLELDVGGRELGCQNTYGRLL